MNYVHLVQSVDCPDESHVGLTDDLRSKLAAHHAGQSIHNAKLERLGSGSPNTLLRDSFGIASPCMRGPALTIDLQRGFWVTGARMDSMTEVKSCQSKTQTACRRAPRAGFVRKPAMS